MTLIQSEAELVKLFRPRDQKHVEIPRLMRFPIELGHYLAWTEPSGVRVFLVFKKKGWKSPVGIAFRRDQQGSSTSPPGLCDWCLDNGPSDRIGLLTATVNSKRRVGVNLCLNLECIQKLESIATTTRLPLEKLTQRLHERMARFWEEGLEMPGP